MTEAAQVALITGSATAFGALLAGCAAGLVEFLRGRGELRRLRVTYTADRITAREQELRQAFADAQAAMLKLALAVRVFIDLRQDGTARFSGQPLGDQLGDQLRQAREEYLAAGVAVEALWTVTHDASARREIDTLRSAAADAYRCLRAPDVSGADSGQVEQQIVDALRALSLALFPAPVGEPANL